MIGPSRPLAAAGPSRPLGPLRPPPVEDDEDDDYAPALPPSFAAGGRPSASALPPDPDELSDDDDDVGPKPLPAGAAAGSRGDAYDAVAEFEAREEERRLKAEEDAKPKQLKRDDWMLNPPTESELLSSMDPTKLKARGFNQSTKKPQSKDTTLWTETPEERAKRQADEVLGKRKKTENTEAEVNEGDRVAEERRRKRDREMRDQVEMHNSKNRQESLLDKHKRTAGPETAAKVKAQTQGWDHERDMGLGGRLLDDNKRKAIIRDAADLKGRFGGGSYL